MLSKLRDFFRGKKTLILGYGLEGQSTERLLQKLGVAAKTDIADAKFGADYLSALDGDYDIIMKTPGIALFDNYRHIAEKITSQTDLFLRFCDNITVGVTGTKGKSTTSSVIFHILNECGFKARLIGNIGVPPLDIVGEISPEDIIVLELSCHQLEYVKASPKVAVLLNVFEEHLDHYVDFARYKAAKENIFRYGNDFAVRGDDADLPRYRALIDIDSAKLRGEHNYNNMAVAVKCAAYLGCDENKAARAAENFRGLEHRLELFAVIDGVEWVNDSISTVPEAAIAAVETFPETDALIIGGMDRGVDYSPLTAFLNGRSGINVIALPDSGHKIADSLNVRVYKAADLADAVSCAKKVARKCCVLSPAAASYGFYKNFEERGRHFKSLVGAV